ncbi:MAG: hypothetical protein IJV39_00545 [Ruminococcus sp.]|nr:hypothetical protein [Ruminococcus sp.]
MANIEDIKKLASEDGIEISEEELEAIAGGAYTYEEWTKMSKEERRAAQLRSQAAHVLELPCELD